MTDIPDDDPFAGLIGRGRANPALDVEVPGLNPALRDGMPEPLPLPTEPAPERPPTGYVSIDEIDVGLNARVPLYVREAAKAAALKRRITMAQYLEDLIKRDLGLR